MPVNVTRKAGGQVLDQSPIPSRPVPRQLPNGDLWLGFDHTGGSERPDNINAPQPEDSMVTDEEREEVALNPGRECPWCGEKAANDDEFKEHIQAYHAAHLMSSADQEREALEAAVHLGKVAAGPIEGE